MRRAWDAHRRRRMGAEYASSYDASPRHEHPPCVSRRSRLAQPGGLRLDQAVVTLLASRAPVHSSPERGAVAVVNQEAALDAAESHTLALAAAPSVRRSRPAPCQPQ
jgi:hypothetical protein